MASPRPYHTCRRLVILAPNWLGDAVMALPAIADVRRALPESSISVAARSAIAPLFEIVEGVDAVVTLPSGKLRNPLAGCGFAAALLLPNSLHSAFLAARARIPERWGYRTDGRGPLLTRTVDATRDGHQVEYYRRLVKQLGFENGPGEPRLAVPASAREEADAALTSAGWNGVNPLVALAPGAAYGGAKRWPPESFAALAADLGRDGVHTLMVGSGADRATADAVQSAFETVRAQRSHERTLHDVVGRTSLAALAGVFARCRTLVTNDSGAMHLAAAVGIPVTAVFGPTNEKATRPAGNVHTIVTHDTWCRPCMLRECPLDHECMRGVAVAPVASAARAYL